MTSAPDHVVHLTQPVYTSEEQKKILEYFEDLTTDYIRAFLAERNLRRSGSKTQLMVGISEHIEQERIQYSDIINFLDNIVPYGKQHVFLYSGPERDINNWRRSDYCRRVLQQHNLLPYLNQKLHLILPSDLTLSSIDYHPERELKILAVQRRNYIDRCEEFDSSQVVDGDQIDMHAYRHQVLRGLIIFKWNLISNQAQMQITQLPRRCNYEENEDNFWQLVHTWLPSSMFNKINLRPSITHLRGLESDGTPEARSQDISLTTLGCRRISVKSPTSQDSTIGEEIVDEAVEHVSNIVIGHLGNFYWLPNTINTRPGNILESEVHTIIVGNKNRVNFTTPNKREDFEYVLSRMRTMC